MANPAPTINQINAFNATQGTTIDFNIIGGTELVRSNRIYIYDLSDNSLICTHLYASTESIHELPPNTDGSIVYESGKSSADFVNGAQYYAQIQTFTDIGGTEGGSGLSVAKMFWCLNDPTLTIDTIPSTISTTSYNVSATYNANTSVVSNIIQQYQFSLYSATGSPLQSSGVVVGNGEQQGTSTAYDISYNFTGLSVGSSYYVVVDVTTTQGMSLSAQSGTFTVSIDTPTLGEATVVNNACDGYISVTSNLSSEYGGSGSGDIVTFETDSENVFTELKVAIEPTQSGSGTPSPSNVRPIYGVGGVDVLVRGFNLWDEQWENGGINTSGNPYADSSIIRSKNFIPIAPNTAYCYMKSLQNDNVAIGMFVHYYDENYTFISRETAIYTNWGDANFVKTSPNNARYIKFFMSATYGNTYNNDICINVSDTEFNGTYQPYTQQTISQEFDVSLTPTSKDTDPYLFKAVGDIYGDRLEEDIVGATVNWNQLVDAHKATETVNGITFTNNGDGSWTINGTATARAQMTFMRIPIVSGHKYLVVSNFSTVNANWRVIFQGDWITSSSIVNCANTNNAISFDVASGTTLSNVKSTPKLVDITAFFGNATIADAIYAMEQATTGSGVSFMRKYFHKLFTADYDTGTLKSVNPTAHKMVGVNQWDEALESGGLYNATGLPFVDADYLRAKNFIRILPSTTYWYKAPSATQYARLYFYDANKNFISYSGTSSSLNNTFTTPQNAFYMKFVLTVGTYGTTYNNDICINISDPTINGQYFPYEEHTYDLGNVTLRGIPKLDASNNLYYDGDTYESDGTVTRKYGVVDLGTLNYSLWNSNENRDVFAFINAQLADLKSATTNTEVIDAICPKFIATSYNSTWKIGEMSYIAAPTQRIAFIVPHGQYADAATFKTAMSGVYLVYELATPTTETTTPFEQIQEVSKYGTLEYITTNDVPVGHNTTYYTRDVFGGYTDLVSGRLTVTNKYDYDYDGGDINEPWISDRDQYVSGTKPTTGASVVYPLANPLTYQLTPQQINTLLGVNNVWSEQGDIELSYHIPITNLLVKRQDVDDVSGNWLTLYSQPITQASDMNFTFIDFLNQYGKTYKYALVPLLTQTQSGVEVEVEGGYTVSDEVQSIFDGVFISDSTGSQKCKANVGYGNVNMNQSVGSITPIGSQYPIIVTNSNNRYHNGSISGMIVPDDYYYNGNLSRIDMVNKRNELEQFLTNKRAKIIKDWNSNIWLVMIMDNIDCSFDNNYGMGIVTFNANWLEVGDPTNQQDLQDTGLINVGGV